STPSHFKKSILSGTPSETTSVQHTTFYHNYQSEEHTSEESPTPETVLLKRTVHSVGDPSLHSGLVTKKGGSLHSGLGWPFEGWVGHYSVSAKAHKYRFSGCLSALCR